MDNGFPLVTECNVLKELIHPPSLVRDIVRPLTGESGYIFILLEKNTAVDFNGRVSAVLELPYPKGSCQMFLGDELVCAILTMRSVAGVHGNITRALVSMATLLEL